MYAHSSPAFACAWYAVARTFSLKFASGCAICSYGCPMHLPVVSNSHPW